MINLKTKTMDDPKRPGYQTKDELFAVNEKRIRRYIDGKVIPFLRLKPNPTCLDVGERNPRMEYLKMRLNLNVKQWDTEDLNFDTLNEKDIDYIFAFDVLEHIQDLLWVMKQLKNALADDGSIYVNLPENARWLWGKEHYFEVDRDHFIKWILNPLGLHVVRQKKIFFVANWKAFFIGVRPLLRIFRGESTWRSMARSIFCWNFRIYEVKKDI
jgi:SAM-dependent methyltransferase